MSLQRRHNQLSERNPARFNTGSNAQNRSAEEQRRLMEEHDAARYEASFNEEEYNEAMASREAESLMATEGRIMENAAAKRMYMIAQQAAELRANGGEPEIIADKENKLQELLEAYTNDAESYRDASLRAAEMERDTVKGQAIRAEKEAEAEAELAKRMEEVEFIINSTDPNWVNEKIEGVASSKTDVSGNPIVNKLDTDDDELAKLTGSGDPIVNKLSDDELDSLKTDPVVNNLEDEKRDGEEGRLSKEDALNEAYAEYETREGEAYDVDKNRVKDIDEAREQAEAEDQEWTRQKAAEEEQIRTLGTIDEVRDEAYEENDRRNAEAARKKAEADEQDRTYGTADEVRDEAYEEDERLNKKLTWRDKLKNPGAYLGSVFAVRKGEALEKWRGSRKLTKVAIGVVALVAAAGAIKLGYDLFNDPNVDANNLPDGGGTPTPEAVDPTPTPEKVPTPSPEAFSDAARTVEGGEGWYQTFNEMDIPQSEWAGLLDKVGPDLAENGWAYKMPNGEWGISQPGKLPQDMLELIQRNR
jgi:hypothetical protein